MYLLFPLYGYFFYASIILIAFIIGVISVIVLFVVRMTLSDLDNVKSVEGIPKVEYDTIVSVGKQQLMYYKKRGRYLDNEKRYRIYYLPQKNKLPLRLDIVNESGELVRTYISKPEDGQGKSEMIRDMATNEIVYNIHSNLKNEKGLHRFRWDLRHSGAWSQNEN